MKEILYLKLELKGISTVFFIQFIIITLFHLS
jgi:hypothetical protein